MCDNILQNKLFILLLMVQQSKDITYFFCRWKLLFIILIPHMTWDWRSALMDLNVVILNFLVWKLSTQWPSSANPSFH